MNKSQFVKLEIEKNKKAFGRWHSSKRKNSADPQKLHLEQPPQNEEEVLQHGNALANTGNYPVGTSECFNVGIAGGCGPGCFVYRKGQCTEPGEMFKDLETEEEIERHKEMYGAMLPATNRGEG